MLSYWKSIDRGAEIKSKPEKRSFNVGRKGFSPKHGVRE